MYRLPHAIILIPYFGVPLIIVIVKEAETAVRENGGQSLANTEDGIVRMRMIDENEREFPILIAKCTTHISRISHSEINDVIQMILGKISLRDLDFTRRQVIGNEAVFCSRITECKRKHMRAEPAVTTELQDIPSRKVRQLVQLLRVSGTEPSFNTNIDANTIQAAFGKRAVMIVDDVS
jgi:hypothetical protein